jgi:hypothetical protein
MSSSEVGLLILDKDANAPADYVRSNNHINGRLAVFQNCKQCMRSAITVDQQTAMATDISEGTRRVIIPDHRNSSASSFIILIQNVLLLRGFITNRYLHRCRNRDANIISLEIKKIKLTSLAGV